MRNHSVAANSWSSSGTEGQQTEFLDMPKFRLQRVLEIRQMLEKQHEKALAEAQSKLQLQQKMLEQLHSQKHIFLTVMNDSEKADVRNLAGQYQYLDTLMNSIELQQRSVLAAEHQVTARRNDLLQATKDRKALEKLKDKAAEENRRQADRAEQDFLDELARR